MWDTNYKILISDTRRMITIMPRYACMKLMYDYLGISYARIAVVMKRSNGKPFDRVTVLYAVNKVELFLAQDKEYRGKYLTAIEILKTGVYPAIYPELDVKELIGDEKEYNSGNKKNERTLQNILSTITASGKLLDELLNDPEDKYFDKIIDIKTASVDLGSRLTQRIAGIKHKLWKAHETPVR